MALHWGQQPHLRTGQREMGQVVQKDVTALRENVIASARNFPARVGHSSSYLRGNLEQVLCLFSGGKGTRVQERTALSQPWTH